MNNARAGEAMSLNTLSKLKEIISCFGGFCVRIENTKNVSFDLLKDETSITKYVDYLLQVRKLLASTTVRHLNAIQSALKFVFSKEQNVAGNQLESSKVWLVLKRLSHQLGVEEHRSRIWQKSGALTKPAKNVSYAAILEMCKTIRQQYEDCSTSGNSKGRYLHDFVMTAYYLTVNIGRSAELYDLRLIETQDLNFVPNLA